MNRLKGKFLLIIGIISILYFFSITIFIGYLNIFNVIWVFMGIAAFVLYTQKEKIKTLYKKMPVIIKIISFVFICTLLLSFIIIEGLIINHAQNKNTEDAYCVVLLGAGLNGSAPSLTLLQRIDAAVTYLQENNKTKVVVSGGKGIRETVTEAEVMSKVLQNNGIEADRIILEDRSNNTLENLTYTGQLIDIDRKVVIISSGFHLFRAKCIARKIGYKNIGGIGSKTPLLLLPNYYVREYFAFLKELLVDNI